MAMIITRPIGSALFGGIGLWSRCRSCAAASLEASRNPWRCAGSHAPAKAGAAPSGKQGGVFDGLTPHVLCPQVGTPFGATRDAAPATSAAAENSGVAVRRQADKRCR